MEWNRNGKIADISLQLLGVSANSAATLNLSGQPPLSTFKHSSADLKAAAVLVYKSMLEGHPGLLDYLSREEWDSAYQALLKKLNEPLTSDGFYKALQPFVRTIGDNHTYIKRSYANDEAVYADPGTLAADIGFVDNRCYLLSDSPGGKIRGSEIIAVNGEDIPAVLRRLRGYTSTGDGNMTGWEDRTLLKYGSFYLQLDKELKPGGVLWLSFSDGSKEAVPVVKEVSGKKTALPDPFSVKWLRDDVPLITVRGMYFSDVQREEFKELMKEVGERKAGSLILDLRNNPGGDAGDAFFIYSFFCRGRFRPDLRRKVTKNGVYTLANSSLNLTPGSAYYAAYKKGKDGYILDADSAPGDFSFIEPAADFIFKGDVYVLTNGFTGSAAVVLASFFRRQNSGLIIGEAGANGYYRMNALDFAEIRLGATGLVLNLPLVQCVFLENPGKGAQPAPGLVPDYKVKYTITDILSGEDPELSVVEKLILDRKRRQSVCVSVLAVFLVTSAFFFLTWKRKRKAV